MEAIQYIKSIPRYLKVRLLGGYWTGSRTGVYSCIRLSEIEEPKLPSPEWIRIKPRLSGICGSDLATVAANGSPYFSPFVSTPFVLGHEMVGETEEGRRVVLEPALPCVVRDIEHCRRCTAGDYGNCEKTTKGIISSGIQTGFCRDTGGGWSRSLVAHPFQVHPVPDDMTDEAAVLIEPFACAVHGALRGMTEKGATVLIIGCGSIGLLTVAALRALGSKSRIIAVARYSHQQESALGLGANEIIQDGRNLYESVCEATGAEQLRPELGKSVLVGGADVVFDCVGNARTIDDALRFTRARGKTILVGMPAIPSGVDWTSIWYKELQVVGSYTYGTECWDGETIRTFQLALRLMEGLKDGLASLVTHKFPLRDYREALEVAMHTGRNGSIKTAFDLREG